MKRRGFIGLLAGIGAALAAPVRWARSRLSTEDKLVVGISEQVALDIDREIVECVMSVEDLRLQELRFRAYRYGMIGIDDDLSCEQLEYLSQKLDEIR